MTQVYEDEIAKTFTDLPGKVDLEAPFNNYGNRGYVDVYYYNRPQNKGHLVEIKSDFSKANKVIRQLKKYENNFFSGSDYYADDKSITLYLVANQSALASFQNHFTLFKHWVSSQDGFTRYIRIGIPEDSNAFDALTLTETSIKGCDTLTEWFWTYYEDPSSNVLCESAQRIKDLCDIDLDDFVEPNERLDQIGDKKRPVRMYDETYDLQMEVIS